MPKFNEPPGSPYLPPPAPVVVPVENPPAKERRTKSGRHRKHEVSKSVASLAPAAVVAVPPKPANVFPVVSLDKIPLRSASSWKSP